MKYEAMAREIYDKIYEHIDNLDQLSDEVIPVISEAIKQIESDTLERAAGIIGQKISDIDTFTDEEKPMSQYRIFERETLIDVLKEIRTLKNEAK